MNKVLDAYKKLNYLHRYILFVLLYFLNSFITKNYESADLGFLATFGGVILAPLMLIVMYLFGSILYFRKIWSLSRLTFKEWIKDFHSSSLWLALIFYDLSLLYLFIMLFTGGFENY